MKNPFFEMAIKAAHMGPKHFAAEFKCEHANVNAREYYTERGGDYGQPLIHRIISDMPDAEIPSYLSVLIQHDVNLESEDLLGRTPLSFAAFHTKLITVNFLIKHNTIVNGSKSSPTLCAPINKYTVNDSHSLAIVKILIEHAANINIQDFASLSPLMYAAQNGSLLIMDYLLSQRANLFLIYTFADGTQHQTALGMAHNKYIHALQVFKDKDQYTQNAEKCLDLLISAAAEYLYHEGFKAINEELFIANAIKDLSGDFCSIFGSNDKAIKKLLEEKINPPALARIRKDRVHAFCMGTSLSKTQREHKFAPPVYRFFQSDGQHNLTREIFSFIQPIKNGR